MLGDIEVSRSFMKRMQSTGEMTEPWGTPALEANGGRRVNARKRSRVLLCLLHYQERM